MAPIVSSFFCLQREQTLTSSVYTRITPHVPRRRRIRLLKLSILTDVESSSEYSANNIQANRVRTPPLLFESNQAMAPEA